MTTEVEVKIDAATGLPELPEGMFWRVGEREARSERYKGYSYSIGYGQGVFLMSRKHTKKTVKVPVMGTKWWNRWMVMNETEEFETVVTATEVRFKTFNGLCVRSKEDIPPLSVEVREEKTYFSYSVPLTAEGIAHVAGMIWEQYLQEQKEEEKEALAKAEANEAKVKFYGDYPPKTLIG